LSKRIEIDGKFFRRRRGKLVEIPAEWLGEVLHPQTMRKRASKHPRKERMQLGITGRADTEHGGKPGNPRTWAPRHTLGRVGERSEE